MRGCRVGHSIRVVAALGALAALAGVTGCSETQLAAHVVKSVATPANTARETPAGSGGKYKVGKPYQVNGTTYFPRVDPDYNRVGIASWYGADFHGKPTANGDVYDMNALTAAHTTLPMPSKVRVTNMENGRSLILTVNDRGPFVKNRIIDVSRRAAQLLGFAQQGTAKVRVEIINHRTDANIQSAALIQGDGVGVPPTYPSGGATQPVGVDPVAGVSMQRAAPPPGAKLSNKGPAMVRPVLARETGPVPAAAANAPAPVPAPATTPVKAVAAPPPATNAPAAMPVVAAAPTIPAPRALYVQGGAFRNQDNARALRRQFVQFGPTEIKPATVDGKTFYRVRLGPVYDTADAEDLLSQIVDAGHDHARLVVE